MSAWKPISPWQVKALRLNVFDGFLGGAKGVAKSEIIMAGALRQVDKPAYRGLLLRERLDETTELIDRLHRVTRQWPTKQRPSWNGSDRIMRFPSGAWIRAGYCRVASDVTLYQGREWGYIGFDEVANVADPKVIPELIKEIRSPDPTIVRMFRASGNPGYAGHAICKARYIDRCGEDGSRVYWERFELPNGQVLHLSRGYVPGTVFDNPIYANDPLYLAQLHSRPEKERRRLIYGDWSAAGGAYLDELEESAHFVAPFELPSDWHHAAGFDWGYAHPFACCWGAFDFDGTLWVADTIWGHRLKDHEQAQRILRQAPHLANVVIRAGGDVFAEERAKVEGVIASTEERFREYGLKVMRAPGTRDRAKNGSNLRDYVSWRGRGPNLEDVTPKIRFMDTPGNQRLFAQLLTVPEDPDDPEYPLKLDADPDTGEGGDDGFDALMNLAGVRPRRGANDQPHVVHPFSPATLAYMAEQAKRSRKLSTARPTFLPPGELAG